MSAGKPGASGLLHGVMVAVLVLFAEAPLLDHARSEAAESVELPIHVSGRTPFLEVRVNGKGPYLFVIDTGSWETHLDAVLAVELGLDQKGSEEAPDYVVDVLALGNLEFRDVTGRSWDAHQLSPGSKTPDGILGTSLFRHHLLTIDNPRNRVIVERGVLPEPNGRDILSYTMVDDAPQVRAAIGGTTLQLQIHSGTFGPLLLGAQYIEQLPLRSEPGRIGNVTIDGKSGDILGSRLDGSLVLGQHVFERPSVHFSTAFAANVIGRDALGNFAITLDQENQRIQFRAELRYDEMLALEGARVPSLSPEAPDLRTAFNLDRDKTRLVVILSPT